MKEKRTYVRSRNVFTTKKSHIVLPWKYTSTSCHSPRVRSSNNNTSIYIYVSSIDRTKNVEHVLLCTKKKKTVLRRGGGGGGGGGL